ncbi:MAG: GspE/PulE family protein [Acholeplasmataceae bacterium]|nr:GspE/PulE family protein [Acholeplasmataceae bacterium]
MQFNEQLCTYFVDQGIVKLAVGLETLDRANVKGIRFDEELRQMNVMSERDATEYLARFLNIPFFDINILSIDYDLFKGVPIEYLKDNHVIPVKQTDDTLFVAMSNPFFYQEALNLRYFFHKNVSLGMITENQMDKTVSFLDNRYRRAEAINDMQTGTDKYEGDEEDETSELGVVNAPAVKLADSILREAVASLASDIHLEPFEDDVRIRYRIDGALINNNTIPRPLYQAVLARYKIMSSMNIAERRIPQDGKIMLSINGIDYDFRVSTVPTIHGEKVVIRIYDNSTQRLGLDYLGVFPEQKALLESIISRPHGILLVTGPTGSGKSTTLYTFLRELNRGNVNITTVEDPVENQIEGINQIQVNPKANLTFGTALRSILRQDPNVIMLGEIRDEETAQMAIRAAITGHLVLSTLHTNDALGTISRLVDMGVPRYLVADAMIGSIAQRLVRKLCIDCRVKDTTTEAEMKRLHLDKPVEIYRPVGCTSCNHTGYRGRTAVFEIMVVDRKMREFLEKEEHTAEELRVKARQQGMKFLLDSCQRQVVLGVTSVEEYDALIDVTEQADIEKPNPL